jgi:membrane-associated protein
VELTSSSLVASLADYGPPLLFVLALLESCFVTGVVVPSGVATSIATILAIEGRLDLASVLVAAFAGAAVGDSIGFWIGRRGGETLLRGEGAWARRIAARNQDLSFLFDGHPLYAVAFARCVAFVRTLMPMAAGMSELTYRRFLAYDALGVSAWVAIYVAIGVLADESWEIATRAVGVGGSVLFAGLGVGLWIVLRRRWTGRHSAPESGGS